MGPPLRRLADLAGQRIAAETLSAAITQGRLHHALLLAGPDGVGKYAAAELIAKILLCTGRRAESADACAKCPSCAKFELGSGHGDVSVLAQIKGPGMLDHVRSVLHLLHLTPNEGVRRVLIVRDIDAMSENTQNALLKTVEEPPGKTQVIVTTSRTDKALVTIRSRCLKVRFVPVPRADIARLIATPLMLDGPRASLIAGLADGSPARALGSDPDAIIALRDRAARIDVALVPGDTAQVATALEAAAAMTDKSDDIDTLLSVLGVWLRDQLVLASGGPASDVASDDRLDELRELASSRGVYEVLRRARALEHARRTRAEPFNYNVNMIVESLCLALVGRASSPV